MPVIRVSNDTYKRLQSISEPFNIGSGRVSTKNRINTPNNAIKMLLDIHEIGVGITHKIDTSQFNPELDT
mgnify:CR=1 FL=1